MPVLRRGPGPAGGAAGGVAPASPGADKGGDGGGGGRAGPGRRRGPGRRDGPGRAPPAALLRRCRGPRRYRGTGGGGHRDGAVHPGGLRAVLGALGGCARRGTGRAVCFPVGSRRPARQHRAPGGFGRGFPWAPSHSALPGSACSGVRMPPPRLGSTGGALPANPAPWGAAGPDPALPRGSQGSVGRRGSAAPPWGSRGGCSSRGLPGWEESTLPLPQLAAPQGRMRPRRCQTGWAGWCLWWRGCSGTALALWGQRALILWAVLCRGPPISILGPPTTPLNPGVPRLAQPGAGAGTQPWVLSPGLATSLAQSGSWVGTAHPVGPVVVGTPAATHTVPHGCWCWVLALPWGICSGVPLWGWVGPAPPLVQTGLGPIRAPRCWRCPAIAAASHEATAESPSQGGAGRPGGCHRGWAGTCPCTCPPLPRCSARPRGTAPMPRRLGRLFPTLDFWDVILA